MNKPYPDVSAPTDSATHERHQEGIVDAVFAVPPALLLAGDSPRLEGENLEHAEILAASESPLPPILVHRHTMRVIDGMHRLHAARLRGLPTVEIRFFDGDENEAFLSAVKANIAHGLPLTLADREAAAARIVDSFPERSDRWIAEVTGLAAGTVAAIRRRTDTAGARPLTRIGRDGRMRPLSSANGRRIAQQEIARHPDASLREIAKVAGISPATVRDVRERMRRGDDPVPNGQRCSDEGDLAANTGVRAKRGIPGRPTRRAGPESSVSLEALRRDPSLRYTESGRSLLRWLEFLARGPGSVQALINVVPPHCGYAVAAMARRCADRWQEFAAELEQRLRDMA